MQHALTIYGIFQDDDNKTGSPLKPQRRNTSSKQADSQATTKKSTTANRKRPAMTEEKPAKRPRGRPPKKRPVLVDAATSP